MTIQQHITAARLWNRGHGTAEIAAKLGRKEHEIYNALEAIKKLARGMG